MRFKLLSGTCIAAVSIGLGLSSASGAYAGDASTTTGEVVTAVESATGVADVIPETATASTPVAAAVSVVAGSTVQIPTDAATGVSVVKDGVHITLGVPNADEVSDAVTSDAGTTSYISSDTSTSVQALTDGGVRQVFTLADAGVSTDISIPVNGSSIALQKRGDGSVTVLAEVDGALATVGHFLVPWAKDANGADLKTWYTVTGTTLVQHVKTHKKTAFPVQADPQFTWGIITGTVYFNKTETKVLALGGGIASWIPNPYTVVSGRTVVAWAGLAAAIDQCVKFRYTFVGGLFLSLPGIYSGGHCR